MNRNQTAFSPLHLPVIVGASQVGRAEGFLHPVIIDQELQALIPPLAPEELAQLEANILADGCRDPLVTWRGILIDGHNRFAICSKHGLTFQAVERDFADRSHVIEWIIRNQFGRRNLSAYERTKLALRLEETIAARSRQGERTDICQKSDNSVPLDTKRELAKAAGVSHDTVAKVKKIEAQAAPEVKAALSTGAMSINQAYQQIRHKEKLDKREAKQVETAKAIIETTQSAKRDISSVCEIRHCSCAELFASGIIPDAVITDPPYPQEFLPTFTELATSCAKAGVRTVAVMSGQSYLPEVYARMSSHLRYRWTLAYLTPGGQAVQQWQAKVNTFWKPILLFGEADDWFGDVAKSEANDNDKRFHKWGQSVSGMADLIERLTKPGALVCDPFCGGGATAIAAVMSGRRFIGCDIDESKVIESRTRLENAILED